MPARAGGQDRRRKVAEARSAGSPPPQGDGDAGREEGILGVQEVTTPCRISRKDTAPGSRQRWPITTPGAPLPRIVPVSRRCDLAPRTAVASVCEDPLSQAVQLYDIIVLLEILVPTSRGVAAR